MKGRFFMNAQPNPSCSRSDAFRYMISTPQLKTESSDFMVIKTSTFALITGIIFMSIMSCGAIIFTVQYLSAPSSRQLVTIVVFILFALILLYIVMKSINRKIVLDSRENTLSFFYKKTLKRSIGFANIKTLKIRSNNRKSTFLILELKDGEMISILSDRSPRKIELFCKKITDFLWLEEK